MWAVKLFSYSGSPILSFQTFGILSGERETDKYVIRWIRGKYYDGVYLQFKQCMTESAKSDSDILQMAEINRNKLLMDEEPIKR